MAERCKHGIDRRFCSRCSGATSQHPTRRPTQAPDAHRATKAETIRLDDIVAYLNAAEVRATYGAVAELVGGIAQSIGGRLGGLAGRRKEASWFVNAKTGLPTNYPPEHLHPALTRSRDIITN